MRKLIVVLIILLATSAYAEQWCEWSGTEAVNCINERDGILYAPGYVPIKIEPNIDTIHSRGYYRLEVTQPVLGENQVRDAEVWELFTHPINEDKITKTWTVRDMTATEIDNRVASPLSVNDYWQWKGIQAAGGWTNEEMIQRLPADLVEAFQARARLLAE